MQQLIIASANLGKLSELAALLPQYNCLSQTAFGIKSPAETGKTFVENALIKARFASMKTGLPALADDSGLVISALNGAPGLYSARFSGESAVDSDNIALVLEKMQTITERDGYFYCAIVLLRHADDPMPIVATGKLLGRITHQPIGTYGFGYDPIFYLPDYACTLAELSSKIKNKISHRAMALYQLCQQLDG